MKRPTTFGHGSFPCPPCSPRCFDGKRSDTGPVIRAFRTQISDPVRWKNISSRNVNSISLPGAVARACAELRIGVTPGEDAPDRLRAVCRRAPERAWRRETGNFQLFSAHPYLWAQAPRSGSAQWSAGTSHITLYLATSNVCGPSGKMFSAYGFTCPVL